MLVPSRLESGKLLILVWYSSVHGQHGMSLEDQPILNIAAVILQGESPYAFIKQASFNQILTNGLDDVEPDPGRVPIEKIRIPPSHKFISLVAPNVNQSC